MSVVSSADCRVLKPHYFQFEKEKIQREEEMKMGARSNAAKVEQLKRKLHQMQSYHGALKKQLRGLANRIGQGYKAER